MKNSKFKSSLLTTTLISASLFGSKPNPGKLQLPQEATQEVVKTIEMKDLLPQWTKTVMKIFNLSKEVQELKKECIARQEQSNTLRTQYGKALAGKGHTNNRVIIKQKLNINNTYDLRDAYEKLFQEKFNSALKIAKLEDFSDICFRLVAPYVAYSFYEQIGYSVNQELLSILQDTSIMFLKSLDGEQFFDSWEKFFPKCYGYTSNNPCIKMLQECILDLLESYKNRTGNKYLYLLAQQGHAYTNIKTKGDEYNRCVNKLEELKNKEQKLLKDLEVIASQLKPGLNLVFSRCKTVSIILDQSYCIGHSKENWLNHLNEIKERGNFLREAHEGHNGLGGFDLKLAVLLDELYKRFETAIIEKHSEFTDKKEKELLEICNDFSEEFKKLKESIVEFETELNEDPKQFTSIAIAFSKLEEVSNINKECQNQRNLTEFVGDETNKWIDEYNRLKQELESIKEAKEASQSQSKPVVQKKQAQPNQEPKYGRKAARANQAIPSQISKKQKQQATKPKTLEDLDTKFGEDLEKAFDELELITIDFDSEDDWNEFQKESNVEFRSSYRHGSHESQEIFFNFEGQKTKGQLVIYHVHGKDASEEISRQIRVTRRIQK